MNHVPFSMWRIYRWPLLLAALTIAGLLFALFGDGIWDAISWLILVIPLAVIAWNLKGESSRRE